MAAPINYAQLLRPVGQMLEAVKVESFTLTVEDSGVKVSARKEEEPPAPVQERSFRVVWQALRGKRTEPPAAEPRPSSGVIELRYSLEEIERMEEIERGKRSGGGSMPEAHSLSQVLRAIGGYVDQKGGRVLQVKKGIEEITVEYETALHKTLTETFTVAGLYDYWVKMYLRRKKT